MSKAIIDVYIYGLAEQFDINRATVKTIINSYISYNKDKLIHGNILNIYNLVRIVPDMAVSKYSTTLAYDCNCIADLTGLPRVTVFNVVLGYLQGLRDELMRGNPVSIRGIVTLTPLELENGNITIRSAVSQALKDSFTREDSVISSVRVHTCKGLKFNVSNLCCDTKTNLM